MLLYLLVFILPREWNQQRRILLDKRTQIATYILEFNVMGVASLARTKMDQAAYIEVDARYRRAAYLAGFIHYEALITMGTEEFDNFTIFERYFTLGLETAIGRAKVKITLTTLA